MALGENALYRHVAWIVKLKGTSAGGFQAPVAETVSQFEQALNRGQAFDDFVVQ